MTLFFLISVIFQNGIVAAQWNYQNGIIAVPSPPPKPLEQNKEQLHIQRLETAVQKLMDDNENFKRQIDDVMESKIALFANIQDIIASQNDMIASRNDKIASLSGKIDIMREDIKLSEQRETMQEKLNYDLKSMIDETAAFVEKIKNTPKAVAFRATCAFNFPYDGSTEHEENPVIWKNVEYNIGSAYDASSGKFTCPYDGIYSFYATSMVIHGHGIFVEIHVNGSLKVARTQKNAESMEFGNASPQGVFKLQKGDTVHIKMLGIFYQASRRCDYTYFQGHLINLL